MRRMDENSYEQFNRQSDFFSSAETAILRHQKPNWCSFGNFIDFSHLFNWKLLDQATVIAPNTPNYFNHIKSAQFTLHAIIVLLEQKIRLISYSLVCSIGTYTIDSDNSNFIETIFFLPSTQIDVFVYLHVHDNAIDEIIKTKWIPFFGAQFFAGFFLVWMKYFVLTEIHGKLFWMVTFSLRQCLSMSVKRQCSSTRTHATHLPSDSPTHACKE